MITLEEECAMMTNERWQKMIAVIKSDVVPATGCTEPISLAFAAATAARYLGEDVISVKARVSANLMKNGMGVMVPGTGRPGLVIAAAVGALGGDADAGLQVLRQLSASVVEQGMMMVDNGAVTVGVNKETDHVLYAEACVYGEKHYVKAVIVDDHTNILSIEKDGEVIFSAAAQDNGEGDDKKAFLHTLSVKEILAFAEQAPLEEIRFIKEAEDLNDALSKEGLTGKYGLKIGRTLQDAQESGMTGKDLQNEILIRTVAASDARMGGAAYPAMTNSGSGNQGIAVTEPVTVVADYLHADEETRLRALILASMTAIYIHGYLPKLSAFCATVTAAMGAAAGMAWLLDREHGLERIGQVICSMTGDVAGMICDGAANSCSMKVSTAVSAAYKATVLALNGTCVSGDDGLVANDVEESIRNIGLLASKGMQQTDDEVLDIMLHKNQGDRRQ